MKKIYLFCAAGMSTSLLVNKMKAAAKEANFECEIEAFPVSEASRKGVEADCILVGPQVKFELKKIASIYPDKPVEAIDMLMYGTMDGKAVLVQAMKAMGL